MKTDASAGQELLQRRLRGVETCHAGRPDAAHRVSRHGHMEQRGLFESGQDRIQGSGRNIEVAHGQTQGLAGSADRGSRPVLLGIDLEYGIAAECGVGGHGAHGHPILGAAPAVGFLLLPDLDPGLAHFGSPSIWFDAVRSGQIIFSRSRFSCKRVASTGM